MGALKKFRASQGIGGSPEKAEEEPVQLQDDAEANVVSPLASPMGLTTSLLAIEEGETEIHSRRGSYGNANMSIPVTATAAAGNKITYIADDNNTADNADENDQANLTAEGGFQSTGPGAGTDPQPSAAESIDRSRSNGYLEYDKELFNLHSVIDASDAGREDSQAASSVHYEDVDSDLFDRYMKGKIDGLSDFVEDDIGDGTLEVTGTRRRSLQSVINKLRSNDAEDENIDDCELDADNDDEDPPLVKGESFLLRELEEEYENSERQKEDEIEESILNAQIEADKAAEKADSYDDRVLEGLAKEKTKTDYVEDDVDKFGHVMRRSLYGLNEHTNVEFDGFEAFESDANDADAELALHEQEAILTGRVRKDSETSHLLSTGSLGSDDELSISSGRRHHHRHSSHRGSEHGSAENSRKHGSKIKSKHALESTDSGINDVSDEMEKAFNFVVETTSSKMLEDKMPRFVEEMVSDWENHSVHSRGQQSHHSGNNHLPRMGSLSESINSEEVGLGGGEYARNDGDDEGAAGGGDEDENEGVAVEAAGSGFSFAKLMKKVY
jgi:hypothetical protein